MYFVRKGVRGKPLLWYIRGMPSKLLLPVIKKISNIKIISDDVFDMISEFIVAQRNVLTEL